MFELEVTERKRSGKYDLRGLRKDGFMPAVIYGGKQKSTSIKLPQRDFEKAYKGAGESTVIEIKGLETPIQVLIHDVDFDPVTGAPRHADFYAIEKDKKVTVDVPLEFVGVPPAVKELGGTLVKVLHELEIEVLPAELPHNLEVDVSGIVDFETYVHVKDIKLPPSGKALLDPEDIVASVSEAKEEETEAQAAAADLDSIEVEQKGKKEERGEGASSESEDNKE